MKHLDLFSGIGLFSYAADRVWDLEHIFCEIEEWPYRFLKQEYPNARIERDIKNFDGTEHAGRTFLLTAGVPCQPASVAGKRKGTEDDRWLWPEALRVLFESQAECAIFENPLGILTLEKGLVFENLLLEMESQGYAVQPYIIPAGSVGAVHRRYRVWIVANAIDGRLNGKGVSIRGEGQKKISVSARSNKRTPKNVAHSGRGNARECSNPDKVFDGWNGTTKSTSAARRPSGDVADTKRERCKEQLQPISHEGNLATGNVKQDHWQIPWPEVATATCIRGVDVSFTNGVYKAERFEKGERIKRMKALGNTIQWEVALAIMQAIKENNINETRNKSKA